MKISAYILNFFILASALFFSLIKIMGTTLLDFKEWLLIVLCITCPALSIVYGLVLSEPLSPAKKRDESLKEAMREGSNTIAKEDVSNYLTAKILVILLNIAFLLMLLYMTKQVLLPPLSRSYEFLEIPTFLFSLVFCAVCIGMNINYALHSSMKTQRIKKPIKSAKKIMWICDKCGEEIEESFATCWNCGKDKD